MKNHDTHINLKLNKELLEQATEAAEQADISRNKFILDAIKEKLNKDKIQMESKSDGK